MDRDLERLEDLLVQRSLEELSNDERRELESLLKAHPHIDAAAFDRAVAAINVSQLPVMESMPESLYDRIEAQGVAFVESNAKTRVNAATDDSNVRNTQSAAPLNAERRSRGPSLPWLLAAASAAIAVVSWWGRPEDIQHVQFDPAQQRQSLVSAGAQIEAWTATEDPTAIGASGDVVWDNERQEGYMRFSLLAANNPGEFQYQLWIFDAERDERYPIDGGVCDIPPGSTEVIIPIRAAITVGSPALFAITVEQPGGVVVSDRARIALVAEFAQA